MTLISRDLLPLSKYEIEARDPLVRHAQRKAELKAEAERRERRQRQKLDIRPITPAEVDQRVAVAQQSQDQAIGQIIGEARAELERELAELRQQVAELTTKLSFVEGLLHGSSGAGKLKFFNVRGQFREGERYDRTDVVTRGDAWYVAKRDDPRSVPGDGDDWAAGPVGRPGETVVGPPGPRGLTGAAGKSAPTIQYWWLDRARYVVTPIMSDGTRGSTLELKPLFEAYHNEVIGAVETIVERCAAKMVRRR